MKKPLHFVFDADNRGCLYREYTHRGQLTWKGIGGVSCGDFVDGIKEYLSATEKQSGRKVLTHSGIPNNVYVVS